MWPMPEHIRSTMFWMPHHIYTANCQGKVAVNETKNLQVELAVQSHTLSSYCFIFCFILDLIET